MRAGRLAIKLFSIASVPFASVSCDRGAAAERLGSVPPFSLVERSGRSVTLEDLRGHVWIADFIFTRCGGPCPRMTASMARLSAEIPSKDVRFVSISVDPEFDTPRVLDAYAKSYSADPERWLFLTGDPDKVRSLCHDGFRLGYAPAPPGETPPPGAEVAHSTRFVVVGRDARIVGYFDDEDEGSMRRLRDAVAELLPR